MKPIAYINVEKRTLEFAKKIFWHTPTVANLDRIPLFTKEALAQPEFTKHEVENADDWSEWVCPDAKGYLMKCCDCGLVHEAEFGVVRYKSETEREACDFVDDPNLQAVFRMRRSEQWSPEDTAHRAGGLPMAQPEQEPVATLFGSLPVYDTATPQRTEQERIGFAGVKIWFGGQQVVKLLTQTELHHADDPFGLVGHASEICLATLKEMNDD